MVRTNYGTGPYLVTEVSEVCTCPRYHDMLALGDQAPPSEPHYHLVCRAADRVGKRKRDGAGTYYLGGYRPDGTCVWSKDRITALDAVQVRLF